MKISTKALGILIFMLLFLTNLAISGSYEFPGNSLSGSFGGWGGTGYFYSPTFNVNATGGIDITYYDVDLSQLTNGNTWTLKGYAEPGVSKSNSMTSIDPNANSIWCNLMNMEVANGVDWNNNAISTLGPDNTPNTADDTRHGNHQDWYRPATGGKTNGLAADVAYNNESYLTPNPRFPVAPAESASVINRYDFRLRILPTGTNTYTYEMWVRKHNAASNIEGCAWCNCGVWNHAINNCGEAPAWRAFANGGNTVFPISNFDLSSVYVFMGLGNGNDPASQSLTWGRIEVTGTRTPPSEVWVDDNYTAGGTNDGHFWGYDAFVTIQDGVNGVTLAGTVNVAPGTYEEQVVITKSNLTITGAGAGPDPATHTIVKSPVALTWFFTTSANNYPVMGINGATGVQIKNLRVDGAGRGNSNYRFVGIGFWNSDGSVIDCEITGVRDTPFSGAQHGNGIYSYNNAGGPYTINVSGTEIDDFQKNGMTLSGNNLTVNVLNCTVMGKGLTSVTAQNGIQIGYGAGGTVTNCSVSDIGYIPATWVASGMIFLNGTIVNVSGTSSVSNAQVSIVFQETQGSVDGIKITSADIDASEGISIRDYGYSRFKGNPGKISAISLSPFEEEWEVESKLLSIPTTVTINNATLTGVHHVGSYGVAAWSLGDDVNLTLTNSDIQDWEIGVVAYESGSKVNVTANHNTILSNDMGFWTNAALIQNAVSNWWGDASGPYHNATNAGAMGNEVTDYVDYSPWWGANYVGDSHATPWTWYVNTSNNSTIQEGIDLASSGDVVRARPGTYNENININKPLALLGVGQDSVLVYPAISDIGQPNPELGPSFRGSQICVVQAPNVTIDGFTFDGDSPTLTPLGTLDARNGIITNYSLGDWSNLKVQNCTVKNIYLRGIYASAKNPNNLTGVDFNHNTVSNVKSVLMQSAGIMLWGSSGNVKHNDVSDASLGIFYHWYSDGNIDSNTVTSSEVCLGTNSNDAATSISYNTVTNSAQGIQTVYILAPVNVAFNNVTACTSGVVLYGGGSAQNNVWDNNIIGLGYYSTYGFWGSTDPYGALSANLKRNTIKDNFYGMVLNEAHGDNAALLSVLIGGAPADHNFVYDNTNYELLLEYCNDNQTATYNYWGKSLYTQIEEEIYHKVDQPDLGLVTFDPAILLGDVNLDGQVSVSDIVYLINYLFKGGPAPQIFIVADVNRDGRITVSDVVYLINYLFKGGPAPVALSSESSNPVMAKPLIEKPKHTMPLHLHSVEK